jgi:2-desacetyl-2-hydroxyethyl bacteriochlorophyllide A dehydrogenase
MTINRRIVVTAVQTIELREEPIPSPAPGEVRARSTYIGVCGSDTHAFHGRHPFIPIPYMPGHEATGVVEELGEGVTSVKVGDRIVVEPTVPCWECKPCRSGAENLCENLQFFGCGYPPGGMADQFVVRADRLHVIPDDMSDSTRPHRATVDAGPCGPHRRAASGSRVAVLGAGTIGLLMVAVAQWSGASKVVVTDPLPAKRELALRLAADAVVDAMAPDVAAQVRAALGESADVVFDCVAVKSTTLSAIDMALKGGTVVIVGVPAADFELPIRIMQDQQIRLQGSATYVPQDYVAAIELIQSGAVRAEDFITGQFPLEQAEQAFEASMSGNHIKVLIYP